MATAVPSPLEQAQLAENADAAEKPMKTKIADAATEIGERAQSAQEAAYASAQRALDDARVALVDASESVHRTAQQQPLLFAAGALAIGFALGLAMRGRD